MLRSREMRVEHAERPRQLAERQRRLIGAPIGGGEEEEVGRRQEQRALELGRGP